MRSPVQIYHAIQRQIRTPRSRYLRQFKIMHGRLPNLENPTNGFDKLAWMVLHGDLSSINHLGDKYEVRKFIRDRVGEEHLVPIIGVYDRFSEIDRSTLPKSFVIKATHGSRWNVLVEDRDRMNWKKIGRRLERWRRTDYSKIWNESLYRGLTGRLLVEPWLGGPGGDLAEIKIFMDEGRPLGGIHSSYDDARYAGFDERGRLVMLRKLPPGPYPLPERYEECLELATRLARGLPMARVDFLESGGRLHVGEMTIMTGAGLHHTLPGPDYTGRYDPRAFDRRPIIQED